MWLINVDTLQLEASLEERPEYVILSHTWENDEVLFQDMDTPSRAQKKGWSKIEQTCRRAKEAGYTYAWVDTCCIDKRSSAELSEAINSMFTWYWNAIECWAYLSDFHLPSGWTPPKTFQANEDKWTGEYRALVDKFLETRWFTRGWTLQELIAPAMVSFFSSDWTLFGTRTALGKAIYRHTTIHDDARDKLHSYSVADRMSWAANRKTTRPEDKAYCLLGIFDINMPLLYGEGEKAFQRLQEEIIRNEPDHTIFAWESGVGANAPGSSKLKENLFKVPAYGDTITLPSEFKTIRSRTKQGLLAPNPSSFNVAAIPNDEIPSRYQITNLGLEIKLRVFFVDESVDMMKRWREAFGLLNAAPPGIPETDIGVALVVHPDSGFAFVREPTRLTKRCYPIRVKEDRGSEYPVQIRSTKLINLQISDVPTLSKHFPYLRDRNAISPITLWYSCVHVQFGAGIQVEDTFPRPHVNRIKMTRIFSLETGWKYGSFAFTVPGIDDLVGIIIVNAPLVDDTVAISMRPELNLVTIPVTELRDDQIPWYYNPNWADNRLKILGPPLDFDHVHDFGNAKLKFSSPQWHLDTDRYYHIDVELVPDGIDDTKEQATGTREAQRMFYDMFWSSSGNGPPVLEPPAPLSSPTTRDALFPVWPHDNIGEPSGQRDSTNPTKPLKVDDFKNDEKSLTL